MEVGAGKERRLWRRLDGVEEAVGVEDLGPPERVVDGEPDLDLLLDLDLLDLPLPDDSDGIDWCLLASSSAASAAALSSAAVGIWPVRRVSIQNCPRAVLCPEPLRSFSVRCLFLVLLM